MLPAPVTAGATCHAPYKQVRGSTTPVEEQAYILRHSRSSGLIIQVPWLLHTTYSHDAALLHFKLMTSCVAFHSVFMSKHDVGQQIP